VEAAQAGRRREGRKGRRREGRKARRREGRTGGRPGEEKRVVDGLMCW
jgi:hypothetical protein